MVCGALSFEEMVWASRGAACTRRKVGTFSIHMEINIHRNFMLLARLLTALLPSLLVKLRVLLDTSKELLTALGMSDVLNTDVDTLLDVAVSDNLVHDDTNGMGGDIVDDASSSITLSTKYP